MSARKPAVAKVATKVAAKPAGRAKPAPIKAAMPAASANGAATQNTSDIATRLARDIDRALNEGRTAQGSCETEIPQHKTEEAPARAPEAECVD